jgi:hypothetical protein
MIFDLDIKTDDDTRFWYDSSSRQVHAASKTDLSFDWIIAAHTPKIIKYNDKFVAVWGSRPIYAPKIYKQVMVAAFGMASCETLSTKVHRHLMLSFNIDDFGRFIISFTSIVLNDDPITLISTEKKDLSRIIHLLMHKSNFG